MNSSCDAPPRTTVLRGTAAAPTALPFQLELVPDSPGGPAAARTRADAIDDGFRTGYDDGFREGLRVAQEQVAAQLARSEADLRARVDHALTALDAAAAELSTREIATAAQLEDSIAHGAIELAAAIVGRYLDVTESPGRDALARALALVPTAAPTTVRLHPLDLEALDTTACAHDGEMRFVADPSVERGGAIVDGARWSIDAQLGPALARAREALES